MLTAAELAVFEERGHIHLPDAFPRDAALEMQEHMWDELRREHGIARVVYDVPVRVVDLTGEPGDVVVCHPLTLHVASPNRQDVPRLMRSQRVCGERR